MTPNAQRLLIRRLAAQDAAWKPVRGHEFTKYPAIFQARQNAAVRFWGDSRDGRRRKADERIRNELTEAGLLRGVDLTPEGRRQARAWTWSYDAEDLERAVWRLTDAVGRGDYTHQHGLDLVPEMILAGVTHDQCRGVDIRMTEDLLLPGLADGWLVSRSHPADLVYYALASSRPIPELIEESVGDIPEGVWSERLADVYHQHRRRARQMILSDPEHYSELGDHPVSPLPLKSGRSKWDMSGIEPLFGEDPQDA